MVLSVAVFANEADGAGLVWRAVSKVGALISDFPDVGASGCTNGQVLTYQTSNSTWICGTSSAGISSINGDTTAAQTIVGVTGNTTASTTSGATTINLGTNVVMTGGSAQTITKALTINSGTLGGQLNIAGNTFLNTGTITFPTSTDTLVGRATTDTLTLKTLTTPQINGLDLAITSQSGAYTATSTDDIILMDASAASRILTLPAAASNTGKIFYIKSIGTPGANIVTVDGNSAETIDGFANFNMTMTGGVAIIQSDGTNWQRLDDVSAIPLTAGTTLNRWHGTAITSLATSTIINTAATLRAAPFIVENDMTIDQIHTEITTAGTAGALCRMGIYHDDGNTYPQSLVTGSDVGTFTGDATGVKTNTFGSPIKLQKGLYWLAQACGTVTTQPTYRGVAVGAIPPVLGYLSTMGASQTGTGWTVAFTFAALPTNYPLGGTILANTIVPAIQVRITG